VVRLLHFSDVHVQASLTGVPLLELASKKLVGLALLKLWRERRFRQSDEKLAAMARLVTEQSVDMVVCTGDHTALGTEPELARAREAMAPFEAAPHGLVTVPGNHDIYLPGAVADRRFERLFGDLLETDLPELRADGPWPVVRLVGDSVAVVAVNSARPNPQLWRSSGVVPEAQLEALEAALDDPRVRDRFIVVATHYAPRLASGRPDNFRHGLVNSRRFLSVCGRIGRGAILHGHVHHCFHVRVPGVRAPILGAGSCTDRGREGLWLLEIGPDLATATPGDWHGSAFRLRRNAGVVIG
jgi:3',5'-cyclic AMP phosphodiesterase CpdA